MNVLDALGELGTLLGLGTLQFNEHGLCRLKFDGSLVVDLEADADGRTLHLCGALGRSPTENAAGVYQALLHANFLGEGTGGAYFAVDPASREMLLLRSLDVQPLGFSTLATAVETFVNYYDGWRRKLAEGVVSAASPLGDGMPLPMRV